MSGGQEPPVCAICSGEDLSSQPSRLEMLARLLVGDVIHASLPGSGASLICIVTSIDEMIIRARRLLVPSDYAFDRKTGIEGGGGGSVIDSIQPLPVDIYNQLMWLDRKNRLSWDLTKAKLSAQEKHTLLFLSNHYEANQLSPLEDDVASPQGEVETVG